MSNKATLKTFFETGDIPTEVQYADLIDSNINTIETSSQQVASDIDGQKQISAIGGFGKSIAFSESIRADSQGYFPDHTQTGVLNFVKDALAIDSEGYGNGVSGLIVSNGDEINFSSDFVMKVDTLTSGNTYQFFAIWNGLQFTGGVIDMDVTPDINILFSDTFDGTVIDTDKWVLNPSGGDTYTQNNEIEFERIAASGLSEMTTEGKFSIDTSGVTTVFTWKVFNPDPERIFNQITDVAQNDIIALNAAISGDIDIAIVNSGGGNTTESTAISSSNRVRAIFHGDNTVSLEYWNTSAWVQLGASASYPMTDSTFHWRTAFTAAAIGTTYTFDDVYVTSETYATETP